MLDDYTRLSMVDNIDHLTIKFSEWNEKSEETGRHFIRVCNDRYKEVAQAENTLSTDIDEINKLSGRALFNCLVAIREILIEPF